MILERKKILVVDDNKSARLRVTSLLDTNIYEIIEANDGFEALGKINENPDIKLIIADHYMSEMDGLTMCEEIRKNINYNKISILIVSTDASDNMIYRGKNANIQGWINKPFKPKRLLSIIEKLLKSNSNP